MFVRKKMTANPFTISPDKNILEAQELMTKRNIKRLPVLKGGKLVGVVSKEDILRSSPSKATTFSMGEINYLLAKTKVSQIMSKDLITISSSALLEEAATLMRDHGVGFLPVVDGNKLMGIITESDIFDAFIELLGFRERGTRFTIEAEDAPGIMSKLTKIIGDFGANISNIAVYKGTAGKSIVVIGINSLNTEDMEKAMGEQGFKVLYRLQNE